MTFPKGIVADPEVQGGAPVVAGTRIPAYAVVELAAAGRSLDEIRANYYPTLTAAQIKACLEYAARVLKEEAVYAV